MLRPRVAGVLVLLAMLAAACGAAGSSTTTTTAPTGTTGLHLTGTGIVRVSATSSGRILVTSKGFTLYHLMTDKTDHSTCTGSCATTWPPLLATGNVSFGGMAGFSTFQRPGGQKQVAYHGEPLYTYSGDSSPGQTNGEGVGGVWFYVKESGGTSGGSTTSSTSGGGYGGGY